MNAIYLIIDKGNKMAKIGFTANLQQRVYAYTTAHPKAIVRDHCFTYEKTGRSLEHSASVEMAMLGGKRLYSQIDGKRTEWYDFEDQPEVFEEIVKNGLAALKTCRGRKFMGVYTK